MAKKGLFAVLAVVVAISVGAAVYVRIPKPVEEKPSLDTEKPQILNIQALPELQEIYHCVNVTCTVTDNVTVSDVKVNITGPTGFVSVNETMTRILGTDNYYCNCSYWILGIYHYYIWANDAGNNCNVSAISNFTVHHVWGTARWSFSILGNSNFTLEHGVTSGSGTQADPYIIENWDINAGSAVGIYIQNTEVYFIIRNCIIHDARSNYNFQNPGVYFDNVANGKIDNVTSYNNYHGIKLESSSSNTITNCAVYNNSDSGISLDSSSSNTITNCAVYDNPEEGIALWESSNNQISNCTIYNNTKGIVLLLSPNNQIHYCNIYNNTGYGVYSYDYTVSATYNWWGSADGPSGVGPGTGDKVSANVLYSPWLTSQHTERVSETS